MALRQVGVRRPEGHKLLYLLKQPDVAHGGGLMRTHSWLSSRTPAWKDACRPLASFTKRNVAARMAHGKRWRCANDNRQSNIGFPLASKF